MIYANSQHVFSQTACYDRYMIVQLADLSTLRKRFRGQTIVLGSGVFDLLHRGHMQYLQNLRQHGDVVVVMVKSDERVRMGKGPDRPILPEDDRAVMVDAVKGVDYVFVSPHIDFRGHVVDPVYRKVLAALEPDAFYTTNALWKQLESIGDVRVIVGERPTQEALRSTTDIIAHIRKSADKART